MTEDDAIRWSAFSFRFLAIMTLRSSLVAFELAGTTGQTAAQKVSVFSA
jgi:hypothetical protein